MTAKIVVHCDYPLLVCLNEYQDQIYPGDSADDALEHMTGGWLMTDESVYLCSIHREEEDQNEL